NQGKYAVAQTVLHKKEQLVLLRPMGKLIAMELLHFANEVKDAGDFEKDVPSKEPSKQETELVNTLIRASTAKKFDLSKYKDTYREKLAKLIEAKVEGKEIITPPQEEEAPQVINLMDALKKSLKMREGSAEEDGAKPPRKMARSGRKAAATRRR